MTEVVGIRFKKAGKVYYFDPDGMKIEEGMKAVVETARGIEYGSVVKGNTMVRDEEVFQPVFAMLEDGMEREAIYLLFRRMEKDQPYYQKAFEVTGQNGFEEILSGKIRQLIEDMLKNHEIKLQKLEGLKDLHMFLEFHTLTVVTGLKYWLTSREVKLTADEALEFYRFLMSHPILDVVGQVEDYTEQ